MIKNKFITYLEKEKSFLLCTKKFERELFQLVLVLHEQISTGNNKNPLDNKTWMYMEL